MSRSYIPTGIRMRVVRKGVGWCFVLQDVFTDEILRRSEFFRRHDDAKHAGRQAKASLQEAAA